MKAEQNHETLIEQCKAAAAEVGAYQAEQGWSERQLRLRFPDLGSSKDWWAMRNGSIADRNGEDLLRAYRAVLAQIQALKAASVQGEELYEDLHPVVELARALPALLTTDGNDRVLIVQGEPGSGKSTAAALLHKRLGSALVMVEAAEAWGDNPRAMLGAVLRRLGVAELPESAVDRLDKALELMAPSRRVLVIDEAHHMGPRCLNTVKTLVNQTRWGFTLMAIGTLLGKLERKAYEEARQISTNRLAERIKLECPTERDCRRLLDRRLGMKTELADAARVLAAAAATRGGLGFARDVCKRLAGANDDGAPTLRDVAAAIEVEKASR